MEKSKQEELIGNSKKTMKKRRKSNDEEDGEASQVQPYAPPLSNDSKKSLGVLQYKT